LIRDNFESSANEIDASRSQRENDAPQITSTEAETSIEGMPLQKNAPFSIRENCEFDSNEIKPSRSHPEKQSSQIT
jgi:hypothetical protein